MTKKDEEIIRLRKEGLTYKAISEALGKQGIIVSEDYANRRYLKCSNRLAKLSNNSIKTPLVEAMTEDELRKKHDMFFQIQSFVNAIPVGSFIEESKLLKELGLYGKPRYKDAISRPELKDNKGKVDGTVYYGHIDSIQKLKKEGVLQ